MQAISLAQADHSSPSESSMEQNVTMLEALVVIILFVAMGHFLSWLCHRHGATAQANFYEKTDKELACLDESDRREGQGPRYVKL